MLIHHGSMERHGLIASNTDTDWKEETLQRSPLPCWTTSCSRSLAFGSTCRLPTYKQAYSYLLLRTRRKRRLKNLIHSQIGASWIQYADGDSFPDGI